LSFDPPPLVGADMWGATMFDQLYCRIAFQRLRYAGRFTPPSQSGSLVYPGNLGVFDWGGIAVDPQRKIGFATPAYLAFVSRLEGPTFAAAHKPFTSPFGMPCQAPPWGFVAGIDLMTGKIAWMHRNGTVRDLAPLPLPARMGVPSLGGPIVTASGVAFFSGTLDDYVRAYDVATGRQLWESRLPAGGQATPMTYLGDDGRQYIVVVAGGDGSLGTNAGDYVVAYALSQP